MAGVFASPTANMANSPEPISHPDVLLSDSVVYAVLRECRHRSLTVGIILCRQLDEGMCAVEAAQTAENEQERRSGEESDTCNASSGRAKENNNSLMHGSTDSTDSNRDPSLFIPAVDTETDISNSPVDGEPMPVPNALEYSLGRIVNNWSRSRSGVHTFPSAACAGNVEKATELFPYPCGRWECGTFLGRRVFLEASNAFLGRGSLAIVLGGNIVVTETANGEERRLATVPVAIKEVTYDARQKPIRNMLELALQFRLEVSHPGFVHIFYAGGYYPSFSKLTSMEKVPVHYHISLACSFTGSIADELKRTGPFSMSEIRRCMAELLAALQYLHEEHHGVHNDVKTHNILIFEQPSVFSDYKYQLTDFTGFARAQSLAEVIDEMGNGLEKQLEFATVGGTAAFMSPESCLGFGMLTSNDIWSLGITAYHMATNTLPWKPLERQFPSMVLNGFRCKFSIDTIFGRHTGEVEDAPSTAPAAAADQDSLHGADADEKERGMRAVPGQVSSSAESSALREKYADFGPILEEFDQAIFSSDFQDFVRQCLIEDPTRRPTARQLREHAFLKGVQIGASRESNPTPFSS